MDGERVARLAARKPEEPHRQESSYVSRIDVFAFAKGSFVRPRGRRGAGGRADGVDCSRSGARGKGKKRAAGRTAESVPTFPETAAARDSKSILARRGGVLRAKFAKTCSGAAKPPQTKLRGLRVRIEPAAGSAFSALSA